MGAGGVRFPSSAEAVPRRIRGRGLPCCFRRIPVRPVMVANEADGYQSHITALNPRSCPQEPLHSWGSSHVSHGVAVMCAGPQMVVNEADGYQPHVTGLNPVSALGVDPCLTQCGCHVRRPADGGERGGRLPAAHHCARERLPPPHRGRPVAAAGPGIRGGGAGRGRGRGHRRGGKQGSVVCSEGPSGCGGAGGGPCSCVYVVVRGVVLWVMGCAASLRTACRCCRCQHLMVVEQIGRRLQGTWQNRCGT